MPKRKYIKKPFPRKGVDWKKIKREKEKTKEIFKIPMMRWENQLKKEYIKENC